MKIYISSNIGDSEAKSGKFGVHNTEHYIQDIRKLLINRTNLNDLGSAIDVIRSTPNHADLPSTYRAHPISSYEYKGIKYGTVIDVHIKGDLILLYKIQDNKLICVRIGTHRDLKIGSNTDISSKLIYI